MLAASRLLVDVAAHVRKADVIPVFAFVRRKVSLVFEANSFDQLSCVFLALSRLGRTIISLGSFGIVVVAPPA